jgi:hypothetical protein
MWLLVWPALLRVHEDDEEEVEMTSEYLHDGMDDIMMYLAERRSR